MQLCRGKKANDNWVFVLNFSTIVPPDGRQTLHPYQLVLKSMCLSYFFLQCLPKGHITNTHNTILMNKIESSYSNQLLFSITYIIDRPVGTYLRYCLSMPSLTYMQTRLGHSTMQCMQSVT